MKMNINLIILTYHFTDLGKSLPKFLSRIMKFY